VERIVCSAVKLGDTADINVVAVLLGKLVTCVFKNVGVESVVALVTSPMFEKSEMLEETSAAVAAGVNAVVELCKVVSKMVSTVVTEEGVKLGNEVYRGLVMVVVVVVGKAVSAGGRVAMLEEVHIAVSPQGGYDPHAAESML
jgi:hypothetical protein